MSSPASSATASASRGSSASASYTYARHYVNGQVSRYTYTEHQAGSKAELTAVAQLTSYVRGGIGGEQVKWLTLKSPTGQDLSSQAKAYPAYDLSLDPKAGRSALGIPRQQIPAELQGPVTDLLTFYVGLSTPVGVGELHHPGQSHVDRMPLSGNFATPTSPVGQDRTQLTTTLTSLNAQQATFRSAFQPPAGGGLKLYRSFMNSPVCGSTPNNFELVQAQGPEYLALYGCETFTVTTVVDRASGQIISARMTNPLRLRGQLCKDKALTQCTPIPVPAQERIVQLTRD